MDTKFSDWLRLAHLEPTHEITQRRWAGVEELEKQLSAGDAVKLVRLLYQMPVDATFTGEFATVFHKADNSFPMSNHGLELAVLAGSVLAHFMRNNTTSPLADLIGMALLTIDGSGMRKIPCLVDEFTNRSRLQVNAASAALRDATKMGIRPSQIKNFTEELSDIETACNQTPPPIVEPLKAIVTGVLSMIRATNLNQKKMQSSFELFREESDVLWWLTGGCSRDTNEPFEKLPWPGTAFHIGYDLSELVRAFPGPLAHKSILVRALEQSKADVSIPVAIGTVIGKVEKEARQAWVAKHSESDVFSLCPILNAVNWSLQFSKQSEWKPKLTEGFSIDAASKVQPIDIVVQIYREGLLLRMWAEADHG